MKLDFKIIVVPEHFLVPFDCLFGTFHVICNDASRHFTGYARRAAYDVLRIFFNHLVRYSRLSVIHSLDMSGGDNLHDVLVSVVVFRKEYHMVV